MWNAAAGASGTSAAMGGLPASGPGDDTLLRLGDDDEPAGDELASYPISAGCLPSRRPAAMIRHPGKQPRHNTRPMRGPSALGMPPRRRPRMPTTRPPSRLPMPTTKPLRPPGATWLLWWPQQLRPGTRPSSRPARPTTLPSRPPKPPGRKRKRQPPPSGDLRYPQFCAGAQKK